GEEAGERDEVDREQDEQHHDRPEQPVRDEPGEQGAHRSPPWAESVVGSGAVPSPRSTATDAAVASCGTAAAGSSRAAPSPSSPSSATEPSAMSASSASTVRPSFSRSAT